MSDPHDPMPYLNKGQMPPTAEGRKQVPIKTGLLDYFPLTCAAVAATSYRATQQHHPGEPMFWEAGKSPDEVDALQRHEQHRGQTDPHDGILHSVKVAWRAMAAAERELQARGTDPIDWEEDLLVASLGKAAFERLCQELEDQEAALGWAGVLSDLLDPLINPCTPVPTPCDFSEEMKGLQKEETCRNQESSQESNQERNQICPAGCGYWFDQDALGKYGCHNCEGEGADAGWPTGPQEMDQPHQDHHDHQDSDPFGGFTAQ